MMSRSVKYLGKLEATLSDQETREGWWDELRDEIKKHARVLCCSHVIGYSESCAVIGDVCVLSAIGTAALIKRLAHPTGYVEAVEAPDTTMDRDPKRSRDNMLLPPPDELEEESTQEQRKSFSRDADPRGWRSASTGSRTSRRPPTTPMVTQDVSRNAKHAWYFHIQSEKAMAASTETFLTLAADDKEKESGLITSSSKKESSISELLTHSKSYQSESDSSQKGGKALYRCIRSNRVPTTCNMAHVPYHHKTAPFAFMRLVPCQMCKRKWVPETVLSTIEPPPQLEIRGRGQFLEARICRQRKSGAGEIDAGKISEVLPFVEYDLQRQLMFKLKILGMNAAFGISNSIQIGKNVVVAVSTCTAVYLEALPPPPSLVISKLSKEPYLEQIEAIANANKEALDLAHSAKQRAVAIIREMNERNAALKRIGGNRKQKPSPRLSSAMASISEHDDLLEDDSPDNVGPATLDRSNISFDGKAGPSGPGADESYSEVEYDSETESSSASSTSSSETESSDDDGESSLESPNGSSSSETSSDTEDDDEDTSKKDNTRRLTSANNSVDIEHQDLISRARSASHSSSEVVPTGTAIQVTKQMRSKLAARKTRMKFRTIFTDDLPPFILEVDDETDKDIAAVVSDWAAPAQFDWTNLSVCIQLCNISILKLLSL